MIVVIPVCHKDVALAKRNLEICARWWKEPVEHHAIVVSDNTDIALGLMLDVRKLFRSHGTARYEGWGGAQNWPTPQNWAWQNTVRILTDMKIASPWLWWEPDATPLVPEWLDTLESEYKLGAKPYMGHIVSQMGHMNGVAVYPPNAMEYSSRAMLTRAIPFDIAMKDDLNGKVHPANKLFAHAPRFNGIKLSVTDEAVLKAIKKTGAVLFHGCNDGTLKSLVLGEEPELPEADAKIFGMEDWCGEFDEAEPKWQQSRTRLASLGFKTARYSECKKALPSFTEQTDFQSGLFNLPVNAKVCHFNPALVSDGVNTWLLARRWTRMNETWDSSLVASIVADDMTLSGSREVKIPRHDSLDQFEDPRVIFEGGKFHVSLCQWRKATDYRAKQVTAVFDAQWNFERKSQLAYGHNAVGGMTGHEKNWVWFSKDGHMHFVYGYSPHCVIGVAGLYQLNEYKTESPKDWIYGEIRGGTPPVKLTVYNEGMGETIRAVGEPEKPPIVDRYVTFFHSSLPWKGRQNRYYMGAYMFNAEPPFNVTAITKKWILAGSEADSRMHGGPLVIFPGGAILKDGVWTVVFGVNDERCGWIKIPHVNLVEAMK